MTKEIIKSTIWHLMSLLAKNIHRSCYESCHIGDSEYVIGISKPSSDVNLWCQNGASSLLNKKGFNYFEADISPLADDIFEAIQDNENGVVRCSDCGKKITKDKIAGRYFAGVYCQECWDTTWKDIEARETYE